MSSVVSYEYLLKQQNIALGKGILGKNPSLRTKAVRELNRAGFKDIRTNFDLKLLIKTHTERCKILHLNFLEIISCKKMF